MWTKALDTWMLSVRTLNIFCENLHRIEGLALSSFATVQNEENMQDTTEPTEADLQARRHIRICTIKRAESYFHTNIWQGSKTGEHDAA